MLEGKRIVLGVSGGHRRLQGGRGLPPPRRRRRARRSPSSPRAPCTSSGAPPSTRSASERAWTSLWDEDAPDPAHPPRPDRRPRARRPGHRPGARPLRRRASATTCSPTRCSPPGRPVLVCPAMHTEMWEHPAVQDNLRAAARPRRARRRARGRAPGRRRRRRRPPGRARRHRRRRRRAPARGRPTHRRPTSPGCRVIVTAGGTREPIDPVRFIGNRSSGKQGHAVAEEAAARGRQGHPRHHRRPARRRSASTSSASTPPPRWSTPC